MATKKVRVNSLYIYHACGLDRFDGRTGLENGTLVKVINVHGCPPANTMGHCYVGDPETGKFIGLVCTGSLNTRDEYREYLRHEIAKREQEGKRPIPAGFTTTKLQDYTKRLEAQ